jgi:IS5 family transposase
MLVLQQLFNLSDEELEFQVNDRRSFEEFVGLGVMNSIPDATTVAFFRERLRKAGVIEELFEMFESYLRSQGLQARGGQIIDATLSQFPGNAIPLKRTRKSRLGGCRTGGTKTQIDCNRKTWMHAGSKRMASTTTAIRTASASMLTMVLSAVMP